MLGSMPRDMLGQRGATVPGDSRVVCPRGEILRRPVASPPMTPSTRSAHRPISPVFLLLVLLAATLAALSSCSSHDDVLARVGSQKITVAEFTDVAREGAQRYPFPPDSAKTLLLNDLVRRSLMIEVAQHDPTIIDSLVKGYSDYVERSVLVSALAERIAPKD